MTRQFNLAAVSVLFVLILTALACGRVTASDAKPEPAAASKSMWDFQPELTVGDAAPSLAIEHWVHDGGGRFPHTTEFEPGKVYVVEFWATWCGPCIAAMPHVVELQKATADQGVQIISVSNEPLELVSAMMEKPVPSGEGKTYNELTSSYCLTTDPDSSVWDAYMKPSGSSGIPNAFVVGKDGKIEWVGHPMALDDPLQQVLADSWDRDAFADEFLTQKRLQAAATNIRSVALQGDLERARSMLKELIETAPTAALGEQASQLDAMLQSIEFQNALRGEPQKAIAMLTNLIEDADDKASKTMELSVAVLHAATPAGQVDPTVVESMLGHIGTALEGQPGRYQLGLMLITSELRQLTGDLDGAIAAVKQAIDAVGPDSPQASRLEAQLKKLKEKQSAEGEG